MYSRLRPVYPVYPSLRTWLVGYASLRDWGSGGAAVVLVSITFVASYLHYGDMTGLAVLVPSDLLVYWVVTNPWAASSTVLPSCPVYTRLRPVYPGLGT